jgi:membrane protease YdiL (CAAX protease family)
MSQDGGGLVSDLLVGWRIARGEGIDLWRRNDSRRQRVIYGLLGLLTLPLLLLLIQNGYSLGVTSRGGVDVPVVAVARNLLLPAMLAFAVLGGLGAAQSLARDTVQPLLLTSASTRAIVVGKLLYLLGTWTVPLVFVFVSATSFAAGARAFLFPVAIVVFGMPLMVLTMLVGLTLAYLLWVGIERLGLPEYARRIVTASISLVVFVLAFTGGFLSGRLGATVDQLPTDDPVTPFGWYADLLFIGSPLAEGLGLQSVLAGALVLAAIPLVFAVQVRIAPAFWYASPSKTSEDDGPETAGVPEFDTAPSGTIGRDAGLSARSRTLRAALGYVRGALRRPDQYVYLLYYIFPIFGILLPVGLETPELFLPGVGVSLVVLGIWLAGALFCLNPLGTEGAMLSQLVLAETPAKTFIHARFLVGVCLGLVTSISGVALYAVTGPFVTPELVLVVTPLLGGVVVASAGFALGIGSALPKFETTEVFDSVETLAPSIIAALVHGGVMLAFTSVAVSLAALSTVPESPLSATNKVVAVAVFAVVLLVTADGSRRYAVARLGEYGRGSVRIDRPFSIYASFLLSVVAVVLGQAVGLSVALLVGLNRPIALLLPVLFVAEYVGYALVAVGFIYVTRRGMEYLDLSWPSKRDAGVIAGGVLGSVGIWAVAVLLISGLGLPVADHPLFSAEEGDPWLLLALVPLMVFVNAPVEELLYRNVIQKYLQEWFSATVAIGLASAIFALAHLPAYFDANLLAVAVTLSLLFAVSCLWGFIYVRTNSLVVVSLVHGIYNALLVGGTYITTVT